ncbi:PREDICTED: keratin, type I cytoskeletal 10-like [Papilio xuthus]|uniref:Keratin, type I cytoskeletal 10-like n=1 Tax=Papilio xuthus TaxID=66420 RepID=A0AAJ7E9Z1_PAPXU|nr:PREDICTED: keratin, type I cytoskeletal 10-like [Papilio xuthus]
MKYYLVLAVLVCVAAAMPSHEDGAYREADSRLGQAGRLDVAGGGRGGSRAGGSARDSKAGGGAAGESGAERRQDYNKETRTVVVKSEKDIGSASEDEWAKGAGGAGGSSKGIKVNAGKGGQKGGFGSSKGAGYEDAGYEKGERGYRNARSVYHY